MINVLIGNIFDSKAQTLVNTVNCVGVMGAGVALEFKKRFPEYYEDYRKRCANRTVKLGFPYVYTRLDLPWIISFPTKDHWKSMTKLSDIVQGLEWIRKHYRAWGIESLAVPPLGSGHGQLEWRVVGPTLYRYLSQLEIPVELYAPYGIPDTELSPAFLGSQEAFVHVSRTVPDPKWIRPAWVALVEILRRINEEPFRKPVGHTIFQKIAYLATEEGLPTGLDFGKGSFGPFAHNLKGGILLSTELWTCSCEPKWIRILQRSYPPSYSQVVAYGKSKDAGLPKGKSWRRFSAGKVGDVHLSSKARCRT